MQLHHWLLLAEYMRHTFKKHSVKCCVVIYSRFATSTEWISDNNQTQLPDWLLLAAFKKRTVWIVQLFLVQSQRVGCTNSEVVVCDKCFQHISIIPVQPFSITVFPRKIAAATNVFTLQVSAAPIQMRQ